MIKSFLITGGAGYIGSHVVRQLSFDESVKVTVLDNLCGSDFDSVSVLRNLFGKERFEFVHINMGEFKKVEKLFASHSFDAVIHFAAHLQVGESVQKPLKYYMNNTINTTHLIECCEKYKINIKVGSELYF